MRLYRAAHSTHLPQFASFAASLSTDGATSYLDNTGFGGEHLYRVSLPEPSDARVLELLDSEHPAHGMREFLRVAGWTEESIQDLWDANSCGCVGSLRGAGQDARAAFAAVAAQGYDWVVFYDSYPEGCVTWMALSDHAIRGATLRAIGHKAWHGGFRSIERLRTVRTECLDRSKWHMWFQPFCLESARDKMKRQYDGFYLTF
jgi:hypothetical protein